MSLDPRFSEIEGLAVQARKRADQVAGDLAQVVDINRASQPAAEAAADNDTLMTPLRTRQLIDKRETEDFVVPGGKTRSKSDRLREQVPLSDYWSPGDPAALLATAFETAFAAGKTVEIPANWESTPDISNVTMVVPDGRDLAICSRLEGAGNGKIEIAGSSEVHFEGGHLHNVWLHLRNGSPRLFNPTCSGRVHTQHIKMDGDGAHFRGVIIRRPVFLDGNYGLLAQGTAGGVSSLDGITIDRPFARRMFGDPIELNQVGRWSNIAIDAWDFYDVGVTAADIADGAPSNPFWGIGIGIAGLGPYSDLWSPDNIVKGIILTNGRMGRLRHGLHLEMCEDIQIHNVTFDDVSGAIAPSLGLDVAGYALYGCRNIVVGGVKGSQAGTCVISPGVEGSSYIAPPGDIEVRDFTPAAGDLSIMAGNSGSYVRLSNIAPKSGFVRVRGRSQDMELTDIRPTRRSALGPALILDTNYSPSVAVEYRSPASRSKLILRNVGGLNEHGGPSNSIAGLVQGELHVQNVDFELTDAVAPRGLNRVRVVADLGSPEGRPYGIEFGAGEAWINTNGGVSRICVVTGAGSFNRPGDTFAVHDQANRLVRSTAAGATGQWNLPFRHHPGQRITLPGIGAAGAALATTVVRAFLADGFYQLELAHPIAAANGTAGTIAATTTATFAAPPDQGGVVADVGDAAKTLSVGMAGTQIWNSPLAADRAVTLSTAGAVGGDRFRIVRTAAATGAFNLNVGAGPLKALAAGQFCEVVFNGAAWVLVGGGAL